MPFYQVYDPPASISAVVRGIHVYHANWNLEQHLPPPFITCLANTEQNLYFYLHDPVRLVTPSRRELSLPPSVFTGPKYKTAGLLFGSDHLMLKIAFHPTGAFRLLGINMQQTVNTGINATEFWGAEVNELLDQLRRAASYDTMVALATHFIAQQCEQSCRQEEPIDNTAIQMLDPLNNYSLQKWASMACLSLRQFERNFITRVGISPKLFLRIVRFEHAMKIKNDFPGKSWSDIALECGYTDAPHLLREFKSFAEFPPSRFYLQPTSGYSDFPTG
jgi:AraC-like DNA-binding protein